LNSPLISKDTPKETAIVLKLSEPLIHKKNILRGWRIIPRRYPYFDVVAELARLHDPESYVGSSSVTGRVFHAR
jgi:hypothetical protein